PADGTQWTHIASPGPGLTYNVLNGVSAVASNHVWEVGRGNGTLTMRWDGTQWNEVPSPNVEGGGGFAGVAALSAANVWAVGDYYSTGAGLYRTLVERYADPCANATRTVTPSSTHTPTRTATQVGTATA